MPVLYRAGAEAAAPLLPDEQQRAFGEDQFHRFSTVRSLYAIGNGVYVVLSPPLRAALGEVRRVQGESLATKRALLASPRAFLRQVLGEEADSVVIENLFLETPTWSERVLGSACGRCGSCHGSSFLRTTGSAPCWRMDARLSRSAAAERAGFCSTIELSR